MKRTPLLPPKNWVKMSYAAKLHNSDLSKDELLSVSSIKGEIFFLKKQCIKMTLDSENVLLNILLLCGVEFVSF